MTHLKLLQIINVNDQVPTYTGKFQEWLECQDFILAMHAICFGYPGCKLKSLRHFAAKIIGHNIIARNRNQKISAFLPTPVTPLTSSTLTSTEEWRIAIETKMPNASEMLRTVALADKREVLRYMKIVTTPVAAAFLGITEDMLNAMKLNCSDRFGTYYRGGYCYSLEELNLIAHNLQWTCTWIYEKDVSPPAIDSTALDNAILVDEATATALTDIPVQLLNKLLVNTEHTRRTYRLADVENLRIAKLNALK